ncbi:MAG: SMC-Scp complex subunit ScpB [Kiloniellales bacterium]
MSAIDDDLRLLEALIFASAEPVDEAAMAARLPQGVDLSALLGALTAHYATRGVTLTRSGSKWAFRTAPDLAPRLKLEKPVERKLSRAAVEILAIIAYHQPVTRPEIEAIRGVGLSRGSLEMLLEAGWITMGRRRRTPGRPVTWVTTEAFLDHFGLSGLDDLPGVEELKQAGLLERRPAMTALSVPQGGPAAEAAETEHQVEDTRSEG